MTTQPDATAGRTWLNGLFRQIERGNVPSKVAYTDDGTVAAFLVHNPHTDEVWYGELLTSSDASNNPPQYAIAHLEPMYSRKNPDPMEMMRNPNSINEQEFDGFKCLISTQRLDFGTRADKQSIRARVTETTRRTTRPITQATLRGRNRAAQYIPREFATLHQRVDDDSADDRGE